MDSTALRRLTEEEERPDVSFLKDRLDVESMLESLNIEVAFQKGEEWICHCPDVMGLHTSGDSTASFAYNEEKMKYNCFRCGGGSVLEDRKSVV